MQNKKGDIGITAIYTPRENNLLNRFKTALGLEKGGYIETIPYYLSDYINQND